MALNVPGRSPAPLIWRPHEARIVATVDEDFARHEGPSTIPSMNYLPQQTNRNHVVASKFSGCPVLVLFRSHNGGTSCKCICETGSRICLFRPSRATLIVPRRMK
jgi:hypothetical protein